MRAIARWFSTTINIELWRTFASAVAFSLNGEAADFEDGEGLKTNWLDLESSTDGGEFGLDIDLEANLEFGGTFSWDAFRSLFGLPPLQTKVPERRPDGSSGPRGE